MFDISNSIDIMIDNSLLKWDYFFYQYSRSSVLSCCLAIFWVGIFCKSLRIWWSPHTPYQVRSI